MTREERFIELFKEAATATAAEQIDWWAAYFAPARMNMAHDSAPLTVRFEIDVRAIKEASA